MNSVEVKCKPSCSLTHPHRTAPPPPPQSPPTPLPQPQVTGPGEPIHVCTGLEWHRFPSSFFLPGERYRLQFIKSGFTGLLPRQFSDAEVGASGAAGRRRRDDNENRILVAELPWGMPSRCLPVTLSTALCRAGWHPRRAAAVQRPQPRGAG